MVYNSIPYIIISSSIMSVEGKAIFHVHKFSAVKTAGESIKKYNHLRCLWKKDWQY